MKILQIILFSFFLTGSVFSNDNHTAELSKKIKTSLITPEALKQQALHHSSGQKINISFSVNQNGDVVEVNAKTTNREVKQDLERQFLTLNFKGLAPCVINSIDITFVVY